MGIFTGTEVVDGFEPSLFRRWFRGRKSGNEINGLGGDEFCASCHLCTRECPPQAIVDRKQLVRGVERWYADFDRCVPYFNDKFGCGICLVVCPWSRPGIAEKLSAKMAQRRERHSPSGGDPR